MVRFVSEWAKAGVVGAALCISAVSYADRIVNNGALTDVASEETVRVTGECTLATSKVTVWGDAAGDISKGGHLIIDSTGTLTITGARTLLVARNAYLTVEPGGTILVLQPSGGIVDTLRIESGARVRNEGAIDISGGVMHVVADNAAYDAQTFQNVSGLLLLDNAMSVNLPAGKTLTDVAQVGAIYPRTNAQTLLAGTSVLDKQMGIFGDGNVWNDTWQNVFEQAPNGLNIQANGRLRVTEAYPLTVVDKPFDVYGRLTVEADAQLTNDYIMELYAENALVNNSDRLISNGLIKANVAGAFTGNVMQSGYLRQSGNADGGVWYVFGNSNVWNANLQQLFDALPYDILHVKQQPSGITRAKLTIPAGITLTINSASNHTLQVSDTLVIDLGGTLNFLSGINTLLPGAILINDGLISVSGNGADLTGDNSGFTNNNRYESDHDISLRPANGTFLDLRQLDTLHVYGNTQWTQRLTDNFLSNTSAPVIQLAANATLTLPAEQTLTIPNRQTLTLQGDTFVNNGTISGRLTNYAILRNEGSLTGTLTNHGTLYKGKTCSIATLNNYGTVYAELRDNWVDYDHDTSAALFVVTDDSTLTEDISYQVGNLLAGNITITGIQGSHYYGSVTKPYTFPNRITLNTDTIRLPKEASFRPTFTVAPDETSAPTLVWTSSNPLVANVDARTGQITAVLNSALSSAEALITAAAAKKPSVQASLVVTVYTPVASVALSPQTLLLDAGDTLQLIASVTPNNASNPSVTWSITGNNASLLDTTNNPFPSDGKDTATIVTQKGAVGSFTVRATANDNNNKYCSDSALITFRVPIDQLEFTKRSDTLSLLRRKNINAFLSLTPSTALITAVEWISADTNSVQFYAPGVIVGLAEGATPIIAKANNKAGDVLTDTCLITVQRIPATSVNIRNKPDNGLLTINGLTSYKLNASVQPDSASFQSVSWNSSHPDIASIDSSGRLTSLAPGTTTITVTADSDRCQDFLNLQVLPVYLSDISLYNPLTDLPVTAVELNLGDTLRLAAHLAPDNATDTAFTWSTDHPNIASVDNNGLISALAQGQTSLRVAATAGDASNTLPISVKGIDATNVSLNLHNAQLSIGDTLRLRATISPSNATNNTNLRWNSQNPDIAHVDSNGLVSALAQGQTVISVALPNGPSDLCSLNIQTQSIPVDSISLSTSSAILSIGDFLILSAVISPPNASNNNIQWTNDNPAVAAIEGEGPTIVLRALAQGAAFISASSLDGNHSAQMLLTVITDVATQQAPPQTLHITPTTNGTLLISGLTPLQPLTIYNLQGQTLLHTIPTSTQLHLPLPPKGFYILRQHPRLLPFSL